MATSTLHNDLFSSLISDIKTYTGTDPLLPWLRGIRKLRECLPPRFLKEKLPRFLQKCAQTFEADRRYRNDLRYLRVWIQLMDFVDDPITLLRTMEMNRIGMKRSLFYQAYALYYEKIKKFKEAEKMYHLGVQNLAEPANELQKSYEQFLHRMERLKNKRIQRQEGGIAKRHLSRSTSLQNHDQNKENNDNTCRLGCRPVETFAEETVLDKLPNHESAETEVLENSSDNVVPMKDSNNFGASANFSNFETANKPSMKRETGGNGPNFHVKQRYDTGTRLDEPSSFCKDDSVVVKFVDTAIVGKSEAEDACHHGLVDPTINMKEAMNAINSMFREPLEPALVVRRSHRSQPKENHCLKNEFVVFVDEEVDKGAGTSVQEEEKRCLVPQHNRIEICHPHKEPFEIFIDNEGSNEVADINDKKDDLEHCEVQNLTGSASSASCINAFVFPTPKDHSPKFSDDSDAESPPRGQLGENTVVCKFVGSTISDEPMVENACHHGLIDPTVNLKEAMDDINNMFGKPIDFVRTTRLRKKDKAPDRKADFGGFSILPDDDLEQIVAPNVNTDCRGFSILPDDDLKCQQSQPLASSSHKLKELDLFEPTIFTKDAMDDINEMFRMPLDF
ncbi:uncharacterized protein LOC131166915 [Malania oleifera]|uniref:uncharacterized protein LOC131166915 n=1 Tax=Malania oleifera TaxID=397392 RepID=UPI0025ADAEA1|nr:uncharacterized protein LOC131166915 [Malania oleifera]